MNNQDRRKFIRAWLGQRCWCECGSITIYAVINDISEGGLFIRTSAPLYEGATTKVRWALGQEQEEIVADAVVVWRRTGDGVTPVPSGMGLQIANMEQHAKERIRDYVMMVNGDSE